MNQRSTSKRLIALVFTLTALLISVGVVGVLGLYKTNESLKSVYLNRSLPMWQLAEIQRILQRTSLIFSIGSNMKDPKFIGTYVDEIDKNLSNVDQLYEQYMRAEKAAEERALAEDLGKTLAEFQARGLRPAADAIRSFNFQEVARIQKEVMIPLSEPFRQKLQRLTKVQLEISNLEFERAEKRYENLRLAAILMMLLGVVFALAFGTYLARSIVQSSREFEDSIRSKQELERQLQQSQKVQALGQLTGGIAHDFNNILAAILGYANLALSKHTLDKNSKLASYLGEIIRSSERARDLVARMMAFARTTPSSSVTLVTPSEALQEVLTMMRQSIPSSIALTSTVFDDIKFSIDAGELQQMLVNLIINSRDAILAKDVSYGTIDITVRKIDVESQISQPTHAKVSGMYLCIEVSDTGTGVSTDLISRIFDPFFTTKDIGQGTGLGLSMVQGIMARSSGHILLQSTPGEGSRFQLLFPITESDNINVIAPKVEELLPRGNEQLIWIVDDEPAVTGYMAELLSDWGYRCRAFNDPKLALATFREEMSEVDAVIADLTMPGMSGTDLVKEFRTLKPGLPAIICTGYSKSSDDFKNPFSSEDIVLNKPVLNGDLASALTKILNTKPFA